MDTNPAIPALPGHPEPHTMQWSALEREAIDRYGRECYRAGKKSADHDLLYALQAIAHALRMGFVASEILDDNSPILSRIQEVIAKDTGAQP